MEQHSLHAHKPPIWPAIGAAGLGVVIAMLFWAALHTTPSAPSITTSHNLSLDPSTTHQCQTPTKLHMWLMATGAPGTPPAQIMERLSRVTDASQPFGIAREHHVSWARGERWSATFPGPKGENRGLSLLHNGCDGEAQRLSLAWGNGPSWTVSVRPDAPFFLGPWEVEGQELVVVLKVEGPMRDWAALIPSIPEFP